MPRKIIKEEELINNSSKLFSVFKNFFLQKEVKKKEESKKEITREDYENQYKEYLKKRNAKDELFSRKSFEILNSKQYILIDEVKNE